MLSPVCDRVALFLCSMPGTERQDKQYFYLYNVYAQSGMIQIKHCPGFVSEIARVGSVEAVLVLSVFRQISFGQRVLASRSAFVSRLHSSCRPDQLTGRVQFVPDLLLPSPRCPSQQCFWLPGCHTVACTTLLHATTARR